MKVYFVTTGLREEIEVIKTVRPPRLLCSYWYFKNRPMDKFCEELGYQPEIILDSGAYSAFTRGKNVNLLDYIDYIKANGSRLSHYIALDVIGDDRLTRIIYELMCRLNLAPVPVVHYGHESPGTMEEYRQLGAQLVALGGTVPITDKAEVARWCRWVKILSPSMDLHLLGSTSQAVLQSGALASCDSSTWYIQAVNGKPRTIPGKNREAKLARAEANMRRIMEEFNEKPVPFTDCSGEHPNR